MKTLTAYEKLQAQNLALGQQLDLARVNQSRQAREIERLHAWISDLCAHYRAERWGSIADMIQEWEDA